jgi:hypothetical protein
MLRPPPAGYELSSFSQVWSNFDVRKRPLRRGQMAKPLYVSFVSGVNLTTAQALPEAMAALFKVCEAAADKQWRASRKTT